MSVQVQQSSILARPGLRESIVGLGRVEYSPQRHKIKVNHPLYDISLIDQENRQWEEYLSKRLGKDSQNPYKNDLKP
jgi:hypothetical protein